MEFSIFDKLILIMETASFKGLLDVILFIIIFYFVVKFLARLFLPVIAKKVVEKAAQQFQQKQNYQNQQNQSTTVNKYIVFL